VSITNIDLVQDWIPFRTHIQDPIQVTARLPALHLLLSRTPCITILLRFAFGVSLLTISLGSAIASDRKCDSYLGPGAHDARAHHCFLGNHPAQSCPLGVCRTPAEILNSPLPVVSHMPYPVFHLGLHSSLSKTLINHATQETQGRDVPEGPQQSSRRHVRPLLVV